MRVLIIEADEELLRYFKKGLEDEAFDVDVASDGQVGVAKAQVNPYDAIALAYYFLGHMDMDGREIAGRIRKYKPGIPIVVIMVQKAVQARVEMLGLCEACLVRPVTVDELAAQLRAFARLLNIVENEVLRVGDLTMYSAEFRVIRAGKELKIRNREFELLQYLMRNKGKVLSAETILETIWDPNADPFSNTVAAHISSLRRKIDDSFEKKLIETIPGRGYRLRGS